MNRLATSSLRTDRPTATDGVFLVLDALTQEHERTVSLARIAMSGHDAHKPLARWFDNYKDDRSAMIWSFQWTTVERDGRRWKVETGPVQSDKPLNTYYADPRAPSPPIFEFRPPPPEPVKPRFNVAPPTRMPSALEWIMDSLSHGERMELRERIRERQRRRPVYEPRFIGIDWARGYEPRIRPEPVTRYEGAEISEREMMALAHAILDRRFREMPPPRPQPVRPPPAPTRRNQ